MRLMEIHTGNKNCTVTLVTLKMAEAGGSLVYCEIDGCGQSVPVQLWEDHLLAHELHESSADTPYKEPPLKEDSPTTVETTLENIPIVYEETNISPSQSQVQESSAEQTDRDEQTGVATSTSVAVPDDTSSSDENDAECEVCHWLIKIADISDHMIAHKLQALEDQSAGVNAESDLNEAHTTADSRISIPDDSELKQELSNIAGNIMKEVKDMKQEIGHAKVSEVVEEISKCKCEELDEVVEDMASLMGDAKKLLKSDFGDVLKAVTVEDTVKVGFGLAKAATGLAKDWWDERKAKKQKSQALDSLQGSSTVPPAVSALTLASETLVTCVSKFVRDLNIPEDWLDQMCSDEHVLEISRKMVNWKHMALELGLGETDIEEIEMENSIQLQRLKVLKKWKQMFYRRATYRRLLEVFFRIERLDYADYLGRLLLSADANVSH